MSEFISAAAFRCESVQQVSEAITAYLSIHNVPVEPLPPGPPEFSRDFHIYPPRDGWTVVLWPDGFGIYDFALAAAVASARQWLISAIHVYDGEYWEHLAVDGSEKLHEFSSQPAFWQDESESDFARMAAYDPRPEALASRLEISPDDLSPYLVDTELLATGEEKAQPSDRYPLGDFWVFTDFWKQLGIVYPEDPQSAVVSMRLGRFYAKRLNAAL